MQHRTHESGRQYKKRRKLLFLSLIAAVTVAGCIGGSSDPVDTNGTVDQVRVTQSDGLQLSFQSVSDTYREGEPIVLELGLENTGTKMASGIHTELYGASFIAGVPPQYPGAASLRGVNTGKNRAGDTTTVTWQIPNPVDLEAGVRDRFPAGARVRYSYRTMARGAFTLVPERDFDGERTPITTETSAGPLDVQVELSSPKPIRKTSTGRAQVQIPIQVENVGDGKVADITGSPVPVNVINVDFPNTDHATISCPPTVRLYDGTGRMTCTGELPTDVFQQRLTLQAELGYEYFETQETTFHVEGLDGDRSQRQ